MSPRTIAVAGCGPAGLTAALLLARDGHRATLFERFHEPQPLGSGLLMQPTGLAVLRVLGLDHALIDCGARIDRLHGVAANSGKIVLDVPYSSLRQPTFGIGVHRAALFSLLFEAVRAAGIRVVVDSPVIESERAAQGGRYLLTEAGRKGPFDLIVDALGAHSALSAPGRPLAYGALWATVPWPETDTLDPHALQQRYRRAHRMAGVLPVGHAPEASGRCAAFFWSLRGDALEAWRKAGLAAWRDEARKLWPDAAPVIDAIREPEQLTFARYAHRTLTTPAEPGLIHIGDAWHATSPQLGQGANMAMLDAFALRQGLRSHAALDAALAEAVRLRSDHVTLYQAMSRLLTPVYQSDGILVPFLRDRLIGPLSKLEPVRRIQAAMVSGLVGNPLEKLGLV